VFGCKFSALQELLDGKGNKYQRVKKEQAGRILNRPVSTKTKFYNYDQKD